MSINIVERSAPQPQQTSAVAPIDPKEVRQANKVEETVVEATAPAQDSQSKQFAALARREKQIRDYEKKVKAQEEAIKRQLAEKEAEYGSNYIPKSRLLEDPMSVLTEAGYTYDQLTEKVLNSTNPEAFAYQKLMQEQEQIKAKLAAQEKQYQDQQTQSYQQALKQITNDASLLVDSDERFEIIKEMGNPQDITNFIEEVFKAEGNILSVEEAATEIKAFLEERARKIAEFSSFKKLVKPPEAPAPVLQKQQNVASPRQQQQPMRTLTNQVSAPSSGRLTAAEKRARAIAIFNGEAV